MKSILRIAAASLGLAALAAFSTPASAGAARVELSIGNGYYRQPAYVQPEVIYGAPPPIYRYRDDDRWRRQQWLEHERRKQEWRERERREHYWRERNEWRQRQWHEQREREHRWHEEHRDRDHHHDGRWR